MKQFVDFLVKQIVNNPDQVEVTETQDNGVFIYTIKAATEDMGIIIGKEGRNIRSIRNVAKAKAIKDNVRISIVLEDEKL